NSVVVVEHDEETMRRADPIIDLGPGAGVNGGTVVASGRVDGLMRHPDSITGQCLRAKKSFPARGQRRPVAVHSFSPIGGEGARRADEGAARKSRNAGAAKDGENAWLTLRHARVHNLKNLTVQFPLNRL